MRLKQPLKFTSEIYSLRFFVIHEATYALIIFQGAILSKCNITHR